MKSQEETNEDAFPHPLQMRTHLLNWHMTNVDLIEEKKYTFPSPESRDIMATIFLISLLTFICIGLLYTSDWEDFF